MNNRFVRWGAYLVVACLFALACVFLAQWQFDRSQWRNAQIALVDANYDQQPVPLAEVLASDDRFDADSEWRKVTLTGHYEVDDQLLVRNRAHGGSRAFEVVVPFHTDDGRVFIVNRGWVGAANADEPEFVSSPSAGQQTIIARLRPGEPLPSSGRGAPEGQVPTIHLPTIADTSGPDTITGAYGALVSESLPADATLGSYPMPTEDPGPHLSYAIQWILFAVMGFVFIGYIIRTEVTKRREEQEGIVAPPRTRRRRDRDADTEDALLDA